MVYALDNRNNIICAMVVGCGHILYARGLRPCSANFGCHRHLDSCFERG